VRSGACSSWTTRRADEDKRAADRRIMGPERFGVWAGESERKTCEGRYTLDTGEEKREERERKNHTKGKAKKRKKIREREREKDEDVGCWMLDVAMIMAVHTTWGGPLEGFPGLCKLRLPWPSVEVRRQMQMPCPRNLE